MRIRATGVTLVALILAACGPAATPTPPPTLAPTTAPTATPTATTAPTATPTAAPSMSESPSGSATAFKIGVVTDVGTIDDKNFNQYSYDGAQKGATDLGITGTVPFFVPADSSQYASGIQGFVGQGFNIIVTVGFNLTNDTEVAAKANPNIWFIAVDQAPCVDETGAPDTTFACKGDPTKLMPNFIGLQYEEDQAGYLAGIVAGSLAMTKTHNVGSIGGINLVPAVVRYIQGYELGAKSVDSTVKVEHAYVSTSDFTAAFNNPGEGKTFATQFIATNHPDVLFQVAGKTGNGVIEAACSASIFGIGVDVDQWLSLSADTTPADACIVTSAEKHLSSSVELTIQAISAGTYTPQTGGVLHFNATNDGIGVSPEHDGKGLITTDIQAKIDAALAAMKAGTLTTCPSNCGTEAAP